MTSGGTRLPTGTAVEVRSTLSSQWAPGFEVVSAGDDGYGVRRLSDGAVLPGTVPTDRVRPLFSAVEGMAAVSAHALLHVVGVVATAVDTLQTEEATLSPADRERLFGVVRSQLGQIEDLLREMILGLPTETIDILNRLRPDRP